MITEATFYQVFMPIAFSPYFSRHIWSLRYLPHLNILKNKNQVTKVLQLAALDVMNSATTTGATPICSLTCLGRDYGNACFVD